jgi:predicted molibdopterin-dependent oxidoreductase YjgC
LGAAWKYASPADVMAEISRVAPELFCGVSYERLDHPQGLQWPCPELAHPGTATVHADGFLRGKGRFTVVKYVPSPEQRTREWPYSLITGRVLQHYNVGSMTRRTPNLSLTDKDCVVMNPEDAAAEGLGDGDHALIESRYGRTEAVVRLGNDMQRGNLFLSFHFPSTHANALTSGLVDPESKCPDYKVTAVRIAPARPSAA